MTPFIGRLLLLVTTWVGVLLVVTPATYGDVTELTDQNFYEYAKDKDVLLVDFYAPWCPDCKNLDPDFAAAARSLGRRSTDLAKVDCFGAGKGLCSTYGVKRWPTLKNFNRGQYTGDYEGGLSAGEIAGYVNTVENSAGPVSNPYAAPYTPMAVATQQCMSRCKIAKVPNKTPCFARCKGAKPAPGKLLPQPVINEKSCAKCRQPQIAGKFSRHCSLSMRKACRSLRRHHRAHRAHKRAKVHHLQTTDVTSKKATIGTLTSADNDNVVKLSMGEALIVPPNAEHRHQHRPDVLVVREPKFYKGTAFDAAMADDTTNEDKKDLTEHERTLRLLSDADNKKKPVLGFPAQDKYIRVPPHDSGDKKTKTKAEKQINYPLPKVPMKPLKFRPMKMKQVPKFVHIKVPPHDSGDLKSNAANIPANVAAFAAQKIRNAKLAFAKRIKPAILPKLHQALPNGKLLRPNLERKNIHGPFLKNPTTGAPLLPIALSHPQPVKKGLVKLQTPPGLVRTNGTGLLLSSPLSSGPKESVPAVPMNQKIVALNSGGRIPSHSKKLESMSPREALKVPYDADDKKRTI